MPPPGPGDGTGSLFDELRRGLGSRGDRLRERLEERVWGPLTELARRMEERAEEARSGEDALRDAGRTLRMACDEVETLAPASVLEEELRRHLEEILPLAHALPRSMELAGEAGGARRVPARAVAGSVLQGEYPQALLDHLRSEALVVSAPASLPPSPADLLGEEDWRARLAGAVEGAREHLARVLDEVAAGAAEQIRGRLAAGGPFSHLRARLRSRGAARRGEEAAAGLRRALAAADEEARGELRRRRLAADLARRERALRDAARGAAELARRAAAESGRIRRIAEGLDALAAGERDGVTATEPGLSRLVERVRAALDERREALSSAAAPGEELDADLTRLARRARALAGVAEEFVAREGGGGEASGQVQGALAGVVTDAGEELRRGLRERLEEAREGLREAGEIVRHGAEAARAGEEPDGGGSAETVRGACRRAAHRLRETADRLDAGVETSAAAIEELPDGLLAAIRERVAPGRGGAGERDAAAGALSGRVQEPRARPRGWRRRPARWWAVLVRYLRRAAGAARGFLARWWRSLARGGAAEGAGAPAPGEGAPVAEWVEELERNSDLSGLPSSYRWMFRTDPVDDPRLVVGRGEALARLQALRTRWEEGRPAAVAVVGAPGSGKTTLLNCASASLGAGAPVRRGRVDRRLGTSAEAVDWLREFLGPGGASGSTPAEIGGSDDDDGRSGAAAAGPPEDADALAHALGDRREIVLLENGERLFRREVGGYAAAETLGRLMEATADRVAWIVTFERLSWEFLRKVTSLAVHFDEVVDLGPLGRAELEEAIMARHRLTGYDLEFEPPESGLSAARRTRLHASSSAERQALLRGWCMDQLHDDGEREIGEALFLWRRCLHAAPGESGVVRARWEPPSDPAPLDRLDRDVHFALAAVALHGDLPAEALVPRGDGMVWEGVARVLEGSGLIEPVPGLAPPAPLRVRPFVQRRVVAWLRDSNVLPLAGGRS